MSPEQKKFIEENYKVLTPKQMSEKIYAHIERIHVYMRSKGLLSIHQAKIMANRLTEAQKEEVKKLYGILSTKDISLKLGVKYNIVYNYLYKDGLFSTIRAKHVKVFKDEVEENKYFVRPPAVYSNPNYASPNYMM
jgi:hypothetical protein